MELKETRQRPTFKFQWVAGDGGPLILMEERLLPFWEGSDAPLNGRVVETESRWGLEVATDYDLACDVRDWAGAIRVGDGTAFVLDTNGDSMATWISDVEGAEGLLVEWGYADSEEEILSSARNFAPDGEFSISNELNVATNPMIPFVAAESGNDVCYPRVSIDIPPGRYTVKTGELITERISVVCHVFRLEKQI